MNTPAPSRTFDLPARPSDGRDFTTIAKLLAGHGLGGVERALEDGRLRLSGRAERILRAAVGAGTLGQRSYGRD